MSTESEMRAILQELHEKFNTRVYGASSYIKRDMRDRIEAVLAAAPQAPSGQQAEPMPQLSFQPSIGDQLALQEWYARALAGQQAERPEGPIEPTSANLQRWKSNPVFILGYDAGLHDRKLEQQSERPAHAPEHVVNRRGELVHRDTGEKVEWPTERLAPAGQAVVIRALTMARYALVNLRINKSAESLALANALDEALAGQHSERPAQAGHMEALRRARPYVSGQYNGLTDPEATKVLDMIDAALAASQDKP